MDLRTQAQDHDEINRWIKFGMRLAVSSAFHPFEFAKILMQLGYEPIPPRPGRSLLGSPVLVLPNVFQYIRYIKRVDGFAGCFRGLKPKVLGIIVSSIGSENITIKFGFGKVYGDEDKDEVELSDSESRQRFVRRLKRDLVLTVSAVTLAQPFQVITVRMMAEFIGNETTYKTIWSSIKEIWNTEGISGFFSGFVPKMLCEVSIVIIASSVTYIVKRRITRDHEGSDYIGTFTNFAVASFLYPLHVVSTCMKITGTKMIAGQSPHMPLYSNWMQCWRDLKATGETKRGSSLFFRKVSVEDAARRLCTAWSIKNKLDN
ncbi:Mitochondrial carrier like 2 [Pseudolycoriella hygida]|uniref:Mitochondrial carrier like 2 n=1 Tax=Pseudolycoriella hygida TaxID=35572 RepID=A0A9Q0S313_9DIPT|nr:Mitochondrial carrier like 2 [Pseudolycoriella hygida]